MREEFTAGLKNSLDKAQAAARELNQEFVGTEHLLLGMMDVPDSEAVSGLRLAEVDLSELRERLVTSLPRGAAPPVVTGNLPLSPKAKRLINSSIVRAQTAGQSRVSSKLLLASLLDECETAVRESLRDSGADIDHLQRVLLQDGSVSAEE